MLTAETETTTEAPITSNETPQVAPKEELKPKRDEFGSKFALLARQQKAILEEKRQVSEMHSQYKQYEEAKANAKKDPEKILKALGLTYDEITDFYLRGGTPKEDPVKSLEERVESWERKQLEKEEAEQKRQQEEAEKRHKEVEENFKTSISKHIEANTDNFEFLSNTAENRDLVFAVIEENYINTQKILDVDEACKLVEDHLESEIETRYAKTNKFKNKFMTPPREEAFKTDPFRSPQLVSEQKPSVLQTLNNRVVPETNISSNRELSDEERFQRAVAMLKYK